MCLLICFGSEGGVKNKLKIEFVFVVMNIVPCKTLYLCRESFMKNVNTLDDLTHCGTLSNRLC